MMVVCFQMKDRDTSHFKRRSLISLRVGCSWPPSIVPLKRDRGEPRSSEVSTVSNVWQITKPSVGFRTVILIRSVVDWNEPASSCKPLKLGNAVIAYYACIVRNLVNVNLPFRITLCVLAWVPPCQIVTHSHSFHDKVAFTALHRCSTSP